MEKFANFGGDFCRPTTKIDCIRHKKAQPFAFCLYTQTTKLQWLKWLCEAGGGSPDEFRLEQTPYPFKPH